MFERLQTISSILKIVYKYNFEVKRTHYPFLLRGHQLTGKVNLWRGGVEHHGSGIDGEHLSELVFSIMAPLDVTSFDFRSTESVLQVL